MPVFCNEYQPPSVQTRLSEDELNASTPLKKYDHNWNGGRVRELRNEFVVLVPINPALHAERLWQLFEMYPEVNKYRTKQMHSKYELLEAIELGDRRNIKQMTWVIYAMNLAQQAAYYNPPLEYLAGEVSLLAHDPDRLEVELGMTIFPPFQRSPIAMNTCWLMQALAFNTLGCVTVYAYGNKDNLAVSGLGSKLHYERTVIKRSDAFHYPTGIAAELEQKKRENPDLDVRTINKPVDNLYGALNWEEWENKYQDRVMHTVINITNPKSFLNNYTRPPPPDPLPIADTHSRTPVNKYNINFIGKVREMKTGRVQLSPFVPSLHAYALQGILSKYPEVFKYYATTDSSIVESVESLLRYFEGIRRDEHQCAWVVNELQGDKQASSPEKLIGFVTIKECGANGGGARMGPFVIIPTHRRSSMLSQVGALLIKYAFDSPSESGLGLFRLEWAINTKDEAIINVAENIHFVEEGSTSFVYAPGWVVDPIQVKFPLLDRRGKYDARRELTTHYRRIFSITWGDWLEDTKEKVEAILEAQV